MYTLNKKSTITVNENKICVDLLRQHSKCIAKHSKILGQKLLKQNILICIKIFPDVFYQTANFLGGI